MSKTISQLCLMLYSQVCPNYDISSLVDRIYHFKDVLSVVSCPFSCSQISCSDWRVVFHSLSILCLIFFFDRFRTTNLKFDFQENATLFVKQCKMKPKPTYNSSNDLHISCGLNRARNILIQYSKSEWFCKHDKLHVIPGPI